MILMIVFKIWGAEDLLAKGYNSAGYLKSGLVLRNSLVPECCSPKATNL